MKKFVYVITFLMLIAIAIPNAIASPILSDDFESYSEAHWPYPNWYPAFNAYTDPFNNRIELDPTNPSNQSLKLHGGLRSLGEQEHAWAASAYSRYDFTDSFTVEARIYNGSELLVGGHPDRGTIRLAYDVFGQSTSNNSRILVRFLGDGTLIGADNSVLLESYDTERWYDIKVQYARIDDDVSLHYWIDKNDLGIININDVNMVLELAYNQLQLTAPKGTVFFDDVLVTPEPATLSLLALGGLALRKRNKK